MRSIALFVIALYSFTCVGQTYPRCSQDRPHQHFTFTPGELQADGYAFEQNGYTMHVRRFNNTDSLYIRYPGEPTARFVATSYRIYPSPRQPQKEAGINTPFLRFFSSPQRSSLMQFYVNGRQATRIDQTLHGHDSLYTAWYANGVIQTQIHYTGLIKDSLTLYWDSTGVLRQSRALLSETGNGDHLYCTRSYYSTGILQRVAFYDEERPCLTWKEYSPKGVLLRQISKGAIRHKTGISVEAMSMQLQYLPEQNARFPNDEFKGFVKMNSASCVAQSRNMGNSVVLRFRFRVRKDGKAELIHMSYQDEEPEMKAAFKRLFSQMPQWIPARRMNIEIDEEWVFELRADKNEDH